MVKKIEVIKFLQEEILSKHRSLTFDYEQLEQSLANETKSSAGDKYETSREMIQQEMNKLAEQIQKYELYSQYLQQIKQQESKFTIGEKALVETSMGLFFIGIPLGIIKIEGQTLICISTSSPIYQAMKDLPQNASFNWQGKEVKVLHIQ